MAINLAHDGQFSAKRKQKTYDNLFGTIKCVVEWHLAIHLFHGLNVDFDCIKRMAGERQ